MTRRSRREDLPEQRKRDDIRLYPVGTLSYTAPDGALESEALLVRPKVFEDARGHFFESWNFQAFNDTVGQTVEFVQDNHSTSVKGALRGLHYHLEPRAQGKLVRVTRGSVFDVVVDVRRSSPTFGKWFSVDLSEENFKQLWIPPGFAQGSLAMTDSADLLYKVTAYYSPHHERSIRWNDPDIGIEWPLDGEPILSEKDANAPWLKDAEVFA